MKVKACALIKRGGNILIIKRASEDSYCPGLWDLPSGDVLPNETIKETLSREVMEETNLKIKTAEFSSVWEEKSEKERILGLVFTCSVLSNKVKLSIEHDEFKWIPKKELNKFTFTYATKESILKSNLFV